jgi:DNA helicase-2/ATP-dependent DNA helicase PcrA
LSELSTEAEPGVDDGVMQGIIEEEEKVLRRVLRTIASRTVKRLERVDYDDELVALRDQIGEARLEDVPALVAQMERLQNIAARRAEVSGGYVDVRSPYFGRIVLEEGEHRREVLIGRSTYLEAKVGLHIVDWRDAPVSRVYYCYDEGDDYEEVFGTRPIEGEVLKRRSLVIEDGVLRRVGSPQGTFVRRRDGGWMQASIAGSRLRGGQGAALRPEQHHRPGKLGIDLDGEGREDKHLREIAALIDPRQFELITQPESGLVVIQGGAGSGKTTVGLHRMAYLAFQDPERFKPERMLVVTFNDALARYVSRVLPALGVPGVGVTTYRTWARKRRVRCVPNLPMASTDETPAVVVRLKKHPAILRIVDDRVAAIEEAFGERLREAVAGAKDGAEALKRWQASAGKAFASRLDALRKWALAEDDGGGVSLPVRHAVERETETEKSEGLHTAGVWSELLTDREALTAGFEKYAPGDFTDGEIDSVFRWCAVRCAAALTAAEERVTGESESVEGVDDDREWDRSVGIDGRSERRRAELDWEDNALLLRLFRLLHGTPRRGKEARQYNHVFVDEAQDLSPVELAAVHDGVRAGSMTLAGDTAQRVLMDNGFSDWQQVLEHLGLAHVELEPLRLSYRSTCEIIEFGRHVLGHLADPDSGEATRHGVPVDLFRFVHTGDAVGFLAEALRELAQSEPRSSVAVIARYPEQADLYFKGLTNAEVPNLRRVAEQDFPFKAGVDVTDVRQVKGLEFDYVVLVEVSPESYGVDDESRHLLHIAATRAAHQLWLLAAGTPSPLLPDSLRERGY